MHSEQVEKIPSRPRRDDLLGFAVAGQIEGFIDARRDARIRPAMIAHQAEKRVRQAAVTPVAVEIAAAHEHQLIRMRVGQRAQQQRVRYEKIAVFAPTPRASVATAIPVNAGLFARILNAYLGSPSIRTDDPSSFSYRKLLLAKISRGSYRSH
jgi:hypothetical protein